MFPFTNSFSVLVFGLTLVVTSKQQYKMSLSPKSESSSKKLQEQRHQNENEPKHDAAAEWQQQDIDIAAKIDDLTTQIDAYKHSLMIDREERRACQGWKGAAVYWAGS